MPQRRLFEIAVSVLIERSRPRFTEFRMSLLRDPDWAGGPQQWITQFLAVKKKLGNY